MKQPCKIEIPGTGTQTQSAKRRLETQGQQWTARIKKLGRLALFAGALFMAGGSVKADVLASWDMASLANYGPSPFAPNGTTSADLTVVGLTRGSGPGTGSGAAGNAWGGVAWTATSEASAASSGFYGYMTFTAKPGKTVSFTDIAAYNIRRSGTGPTTGIWQYQVGSAGTFVDIGSPITWGSTTSASGNNQAAIDLSGIAALQNVAPGTTVTIRVLAWGGASTGTWYINNKSAVGIDLQIDGTTAIAAPAAPALASVTGILTTGFTANWATSTGATGYQLDVSLASDFSSFVSGYNNLDVGNVLTTPVSGLSAGTTYYYRVRAYNGSGTSASSPTGTVITSVGGTPSMTVTLPGQPAANTGTPNTQTVGSAFNITLTVTTDGTTTDVTYTGNKTITFSGPTGSPTYPATVTFSSGVGVANVTLTKAEAASIKATDGAIAGVASSALTVNPGAIANYTVTTPATATVGLPFAVTVLAKDAYNNAVTTDSSTAVTLNGVSGNVSFDTNPQTLVNGTFTVNATDSLIETTVIAVTDGNSKIGTSANVAVLPVPQYRSKQDGNWNDVATWSVSTDSGVTWNDATATPTFADSTNTVLNTVTITANVTLDQVVVASGGTLVMSSAFAVNDGAGDDIDVQNGGIFVLGVGSIPTFASGATAKIETGGTLRVNASGLTGNGAGANSSSFIYGNASVLEFNFNGAFSASGVTFFPNVDANTVPIFRNAKGNVTVGGGSPTVFNGVFEVNSGLTVSWTGAGAKTFRNGIRGDGNVNQGTAGQFIINGAVAELGGGGTVTLGGSGLSIDPASVTTLSADNTVNTGAGAMTVGGVLDLGGHTLTADVTVAAGGTLRGNGTVAGTATVSGGATVSPGSGIGTITFNNTPVLLGTSVLEIDRAAVPNADTLASGSGSFNLGGIVSVVNNGAPLQAGDSFTLFTAGSFSGIPDSITLPTLAEGLSWDTATLYTTGVLTVIGSGGAPIGGTLGIQSQAGGAVQMSFTGTAGGIYQLQYSDTLAPANWQNLGDPFVMPVGGSTNIMDVGTATSRYYRTATSLP